ncbi:MAG: hypothetical protein ACI4SG_00750 [Oligosphaeraceae bacterium]
MPSRHALMGILIAIFLASMAASCMTEREYQLRKRDLEAKAAHAPTYQPLLLQGPLSLEKGASLAVTVPSQPFAPAEIPSDADSIRGTIQGAVSTGALLGGAMYGIRHAAGDTRITTTTAPTETPAP